MALLYQPGYDPTRVYDGTDTRAFGLLIGAALAFVWPSRHLREDVTGQARWMLDGAGAAGLAVFAVLVWRTSEYSAFIYRGGMVLLSFAHGADGGGRRLAGQQVRPGARVAAAALARRPLLRHLPVALSRSSC